MGTKPVRHLPSGVFSTSEGSGQREPPDPSLEDTRGGEVRREPDQDRLVAQGARPPSTRGGPTVPSAVVERGNPTGSERMVLEVPAPSREYGPLSPTKCPTPGPRGARKGSVRRRAFLGTTQINTSAATGRRGGRGASEEPRQVV